MRGGLVEGFYTKAAGVWVGFWGRLFLWHECRLGWLHWCLWSSTFGFYRGLLGFQGVWFSALACCRFSRFDRPSRGNDMITSFRKLFRSSSQYTFCFEGLRGNNEY